MLLQHYLMLTMADAAVAQAAKVVVPLVLLLL